jgi:hypothetical protein
MCDDLEVDLDMGDEREELRRRRDIVLAAMMLEGKCK